MKKAVLVVLDGFGLAPPGPGNAVYLANPTNINSYLYTYPNTTLKASGEAVGLPAGEVGNTEVGHLNLGAGRVVYQDLPRINMSIADGSFYKNPTLLAALEHLHKTHGKLHLIGLIGEGAVHSSVDHLFAILYFAKEQHLQNVFVHAITDGRDSPPKSATETIKRVAEHIKQNGVGQIASIMGRYYAMDRDKRWERTEVAYRALTEGKGVLVQTAEEAIENSYQKSKTDEFIEPALLPVNNGQPALIQAGDAVLFFNFRIDRPRQLTKAFVLDNFETEANKAESFDPYAIKYFKTHLPTEQASVSPPFQRGPKIPNLFFITMTEYEKNLSVQVAFPPVVVKLPLGRIIASQGFSQLRMSESEKERFVTFYFNGQQEQPFENEERLITPSPKVPTYDLKPEMSAREQTATLLQKMEEEKYVFILINFANPDMVGHTGNIEASIKAVQTIDECVAKIVNQSGNHDYAVFITADHGNVEQKINPQTGQISTEHTNNPVPFIAVHNQYQGRMTRLQSGILADVAPTILAYLDIPKPSDMTGRDLLEEIR